MDAWSSPLSWTLRAGVLPDLGDSIVIPRGIAVLLDVSPPVLSGVNIQGLLLFQDGSDREFKFAHILIDGGELRVGTKQSPFTSHATFTAVGSRGDPTPHGGSIHSKGIEVRNGGKLNLHGAPHLPSWAHLASTASAGSSSVIVDHSDVLSWQVGDQILIVATGFDQDETETRKIESINSVTGELTLDAPLQFEHFADSATGDWNLPIAIQAEVAVLTRNVVIQGDEASTTSKYGVSIVVDGSNIDYRQISENVIMLSNVEIVRCGQQGVSLAYPLHVLDDRDVQQRGSFLQDVTVRQAWQNGIVLTGVQGFRASGVVVYDVDGHAFMLPNGDEERNVIHECLSASVYPTGSADSWHSSLASSFFISSPQNSLTGNAAAGSLTSGVWLAFPQFPRNKAFSLNKCPSDRIIGDIRNNSAHSTSVGFWIFPFYLPRQDECGTEQLTSSTEVDAAESTIHDTKTWKTLGAGIDIGLIRCSVILDGVVSLDSRRNGIAVASVDLSASSSCMLTFRDVLVVARSENTNGNQAILCDSGACIHGFSAPSSDGWLLDGVTFAHFSDSEEYAIGTCHMCHIDGADEPGVSLGNVQNLVFETTTNLVRWGINANDAIYDIDGSLTGSTDSVLLSSERLHLAADTCSTPDLGDAFVTIANVPSALICPSNVKLHRVTILEPHPSSVVASTLEITTAFGTSVVPSTKSSSRPWARGWTFWVGSGSPDSYADLTLKQSENTVAWDRVSLWLENRTALPASGLLIKFQLGSQVAGASALNRRRTIFGHVSQTSGRTAHALSVGIAHEPVFKTTGGFDVSLVPAVFPTRLYSVAGTGRTLQFLAAPDRYEQDVVEFTTLPCSLEFACPIYSAPISPSATIYWSTESDWTGVGLTVPEDGDELVVPKGLTVIVDVPATPILSLLQIEGRVQFSDSQNTELHAFRIHIFGGSLVAGSEGSPHPMKVDIVLHNGLESLIVENVGSSSEETWDLGSAVIANFGVLELYGAEPSVVWTRLTSGSNQSSLFLDDDVGSGSVPWQPGDTVVITSTEFDPSQTETAVISDVMFTLVNAPFHGFIFSSFSGVGKLCFSRKRNGLHSQQQADYCWQLQHGNSCSDWDFISQN